MKLLVIIPARGGSKGLPGKNIRPLCGKPLIGWTIDAARGIVPDKDICVSTDSVEIANTVKNYGLEVPFLRPKELATDTATTNDVLVHALNFYQQQGREYDAILLLQPTSPLRTAAQVHEALALYETHPGIDMVVSVKKSHAAAVISHENEEGWLIPTLNTHSGPRQQITSYYEYNGAIYIINPISLQKKGIPNFTKRLKYVMSEETSYDIDSLTDWQIVEHFMRNK
ncbi:acylneuraminate cytidylyltransferase family protein [uncultured Rikenella sp.]|uniref:acylneuraminate cytidylyltransferase family protein n=1 Tax=uncultured Rikenella sp. TaxID=368003 RepID=UPI00261952D7|nr:acylneuraminate cytidylyltransferase family protein [uncultured Rikenella sp.]